MKLTLNIQTGNDAYVGDLAELTVAERLAEVAERIKDGHTEGVILDGVNNSAQIGSWKYTLEEPVTLRIAFHADESFVDREFPGRFVVAAITEGEPGYVVAASYATVESAIEEASRRNNQAGLTAEEVLNIRASSMAASRIGD